MPAHPVAFVRGIDEFAEEAHVPVLQRPEGHLAADALGDAEGRHLPQPVGADVRVRAEDAVESVLLFRQEPADLLPARLFGEQLQEPQYAGLGAPERLRVHVAQVSASLAHALVDSPDRHIISKNAQKLIADASITPDYTSTVLTRFKESLIG